MPNTNIVPMPVTEDVATQQDTIRALLKKSKRQAVPLRRSFLQASRSGGAGPLAKLVRQSQALDLYLLYVALASKEPWEVKMSAGTLGRALGWGDDRRGALAVARAGTQLEKLRLIQRFPLQRATGIRLLREDGSADPYTNPDGKEERDLYMRIPLVYWLDGWQGTLTQPEKIVLLIALTRGPGFTLPEARAKLFYGISEDTVHRGLTRLMVNRGLLRRFGERKKAPLAHHGYTYVNRYTLQPPFARRSTRSEEVVPMKVEV